MNHPITWGEVVTVIICIMLGFMVLGFIGSVISGLVAYRRDTRTEEDEKVEPGEPYAGKTLGL